MNNKITRAVDGTKTHRLPYLNDKLLGKGGGITFTVESGAIVDIVSGRHARGRTRYIWIESITGQRIQVYGIVGGQNGWDEKYGWLHQGAWVPVIEAKLDEILTEIERLNDDIIHSKADQKRRERILLESGLAELDQYF